MSLWFSATAIGPSLARAGIDVGESGLFTSAVQIGFVVGTLLSAGLGLADRVPPRVFFALSALAAAAFNAMLLTADPVGPAFLVLRFLTGVCMAGIYPIGMKLAASWARGDMGLMIGLLVGALTLGSATPHLFNALGGLDWRLTLASASGAAFAAAILIGRAGIGPNLGPAPKLDPATGTRRLDASGAEARHARLSRPTCGSSTPCGPGSGSFSTPASARH